MGLAALVLLVAGGTFGCGLVPRPPSPPPTPTPAAATTAPTPVPTRVIATFAPAKPTETSLPPTPSPTPTRPEGETSQAALQGVLRYIPPQWANQHPTGFLGPLLFFLDFARMRADLGLPEVTGADSREAKIEFLKSLNTQGLPWAEKSLAPLSGGAFEKWGWDVADVDQALYVPDLKTSILVGNFGRPEVEERLLAMGYEQQPYGTFDLFLAEDKELGFAVKPDTLLISPYPEDLEFLMVRGMFSPSGLDRHPSVAAVLEHLGSPWGAVLAPSGDPEGLDPYFEDLLLVSLQPKAEDFIKEYRLGVELEMGWDFMAIAFRPADSATSMRFLYHYLNQVQAEKDVELVKWTLREAPFLASKWQTWGDVLSLEEIEVRGSILRVETTTRGKSLLGSSLTRYYDLNFLPIRATSQ